MLAQTAMSQDEISDINDSVYSVIDPNNLKPRDNESKHWCSLTCGTSNKRRRRDAPVVTLAINDSDVYHRTGFVDKKAMLVFIVIVHNGDIQSIANSKTSTLTWFEEWFFYFEMMHGKTIMRWKDAGVLYNIREDV